MDKRILKVVELVDKLNKKGEWLILDLTPSQLTVRDRHDGFKTIIADITEFDTIYFDEWFERSYDAHMDSLVAELELRSKTRGIE